MAARAFPHEPQKRCPSGLAAPQFPQTLIAHSVERAQHHYHPQLGQAMAAASISGAYEPVRAALLNFARR
jgi:hypothetical protein